MESHGERLGRYLLYEPIASGGMASVHFGRILGAMGFARTVAIKRLHPHLARDPEFVAMFLDEARLAGQIRHLNVVPTLDVVALEGELFVVMEYVNGDSLARLTRVAAKGPIPLSIGSAILSGALHGLHAAHEACDERGGPLHLVHRDVSPQNILIGEDGVARVVDFGVAKAVSRLQTTHDGKLKGKIAYMAPEQLDRRPVDRRADVYAAAVVLWEVVAGERLFKADDDLALIPAILRGDIPDLAASRPDATVALEACLRRGLALNPTDRYATALEFAQALENAAPAAPQDVVADWVKCTAGEQLALRARRIAAIASLPATDSTTAAGAQRILSATERARIVEAETIHTAVAPLRRAHPKSSWTRYGLVLAVVGIAALAMIRSRAPRPALAPPSGADVAGAVATTPPPTAAPPVTATATAVAAGAASSADRPAATPPRPPKAPSPVRPKSSPPPPLPGVAPSRPGCDPPTYLDAQGIKRIKADCL